MKRSPVVTYINRVAKAQDIRRKLLITLAILIIYRAVAHIPVPGADRTALAGLFAGGGSSFLAIMNMLSGGTIETFSVLAMGVYPYITAQIILQLLIPIVPAWKARMEEDQREGRRWMEKWTYVLAIPMAALQAFGQIQIFNTLGPTPVLPNFGFSGSSLLPSVAILVAMTAGTMFAIWLGELISEYGIKGQGLSLIIFAGIVTQIPSNIGLIWESPSDRWLLLAFMFLITVLTVFAIVYVQQGRRNVPVMYPGRRVGNRMSMPVKASLPLMVNMAGMIPLIFAQSILTFPAIMAGVFAGSQTEWVRNTSAWVTSNFGGDTGLYWLMFFLMVVAFTFFYTDVVFAQQNYGENLKRSGAQIPGVVRGEKTQAYLTKVLRRITFPGAFFLGFIAVLPYLLAQLLPSIGLASAGGVNPQAGGLLLVSSSGLLIVVGVVRDLFFNIDAELKLHGYDDSLLVR